MSPPARQPNQSPTTAGVVESCHELLKWLIPRLDDFPRNRRFTLGGQLEEGVWPLAGAIRADVLTFPATPAPAGRPTAMGRCCA